MEKCLVCEVLMDALKVVLTDRDVDGEINYDLRKACNLIPDSKRTLVCEFLHPDF